MIRLLELEQVGTRRTRVALECDGRRAEYLVEQIAPAPDIVLTTVSAEIYDDLIRYALPSVEGRRSGAITIPAIHRLRQIVSASWRDGTPELPLVIANAPPGPGELES